MQTAILVLAVVGAWNVIAFLFTCLYVYLTRNRPLR